MARPRKFDGRVSTQIRFAPELHERIHAAAAERDLSANYLINRAVEEFLDRLIPIEDFRLTRDPAKPD